MLGNTLHHAKCDFSTLQKHWNIPSFLYSITSCGTAYRCNGGWPLEPSKEGSDTSKLKAAGEGSKDGLLKGQCIPKIAHMINDFAVLYGVRGECPIVMPGWVVELENC